jgi:uncharacterized membrane protein YfcA
MGRLAAMPDWLLPSDVATLTVLALAVAAFFAGFVDSVVGGGGLIQLPVMFALFPRTPPAILIGTNKLISVFGTSSAAVQYLKRTRIDWHAVLPASLAALVFAFLGALAATRVPPDLFRAVLPFILIAVAAYVFARKDLGQDHAPRHFGRAARRRGTIVGAATGFYDGIFGPGTGSFLAFIFVHWFGFDFLRASAAAKVVNVACNIAGIVAFAIFAKIWVGLALLMAVFNVAGSLAGSHLALRLGSGFIRRVFLVVVIALIVKTSYDGLKPLIWGN